MSKSIGKHLTTVHHPESVVEVYLNLERGVVTEIKSLNNNRQKRYEYSVSDYLFIVKNFKGIDRSIEQFMKN